MLDHLLDRTVRLAVTGLSGAGKTVFITSLIHNLMSATANPAVLPLLRVKARGRFVAARLAPGVSLARRAFPYAELIQSLGREPPEWPPSTRGISEARLAIRYRPRHLVARQVTSVATLNLDVVDYPGEWLLDLPLLDKSFAEWSRENFELSLKGPRASASADWRGYLAGHKPGEPSDGTVARRAADLYREYLVRCRTELGLSLLQPGRFLSPGEFEGAPMLWFCPLPVDSETPRRRTLHAEMAERFEAYKTHVVRGFYRAHFRAFDRQAVLVDVLRALNTGRDAFEDAQRALAAVLQSFRFGRARWLAPLLGARIDRVLFLATKADHVTPSQYANLRQLLERMMTESSLDMRFKGGEVETRIVASVRCTELGTGVFQGKEVGMLSGTLVGESTPSVLFPGEVPAGPPSPGEWATNRPDFPAFRPPRIDPAPSDGIPQIGLDEALEALIGDKFI